MPGSNPSWALGYVPAASEWNNLWAEKADYSQVFDVNGNSGGLNVIPTGATTALSLATLTQTRVPLLQFFGGVPVAAGATTGTDNAAAFAAMNAWLATINNAPLVIEFGGQIFATSVPWTPPGNCCPNNGGLLALPGTGGGWTTSNALLQISNAGVSPTSFKLDCNRLAYWGCIVTATSQIQPQSLTVTHWNNTGGVNGGGVLINGGKVNGGPWNLAQYGGSDSEVTQPNLWSGCALKMVGCADSKVNNIVANWCQYPIYVDEGSFSNVFIAGHPFNGDNGNVVQNAVNLYCAGYNNVFSDFEWDSGAILIVVDSSTHSQSPPHAPNTFTGVMFVQGTANASYPSYFRVRSTQANTTLDGLVITDFAGPANNMLPIISCEPYGAQVATGVASGQTATTALALSSSTGTIAIGNQVEGFGVPGQTYVMSGSGLSWVTNNAITLTAGTALTFTATTGTFNTADIPSGWIINPASPAASTAPTSGFRMNGTTENFVSNLNLLGLSTFYGALQNAVSHATYTLQQSDSGGTILANTSSGVITLPNSLPQGFRCKIMTNTTGVTVVTGTGAKIAGNTGVTLPLSNGAAIEIEVLFNSGGNTANYSVIGNGNPVVPISESSITVGSSPFTYTAPSNCYVTINPITNVSAMNINRSGTPRTIPVSGQVELGLGDKLTVTYSTAPTMFFWPNG